MNDRQYDLSKAIQNTKPTSIHQNHMRVKSHIHPSRKNQRIPDFHRSPTRLQLGSVECGNASPYSFPPARDNLSTSPLFPKPARARASEPCTREQVRFFFRSLYFVSFAKPEILAEPCSCFFLSLYYTDRCFACVFHWLAVYLARNWEIFFLICSEVVVYRVINLECSLLVGVLCRVVWWIEV